MNGIEGQWAEWAPTMIAALALMVSIGFGLSNRGTARKALRLSEEAEARRQPRLDLYVHDSAVWRERGTGARDHAVSFRVVNPTDLPNALVMAELHVTYAAGDRLSTVKVPPTKTPGLAQEIEAMTLPQRLEANDAVSGWLVFHIPGDLVASTDVHRYDLVVRDVHEIYASVQLGVFRESGD